MKLSFPKICLLSIAVTISSAIIAQPPNGTRPTDSTRRVPPVTSTGPKAYKEVITDKAVSRSGFFKVHKVEDNIFLKSRIRCWVWKF